MSRVCGRCLLVWCLFWRQRFWFRKMGHSRRRRTRWRTRLRASRRFRQMQQLFFERRWVPLPQPLKNSLGYVLIRRTKLHSLHLLNNHGVPVLVPRAASSRVATGALEDWKPRIPFRVQKHGLLESFLFLQSVDSRVRMDRVLAPLALVLAVARTVIRYAPLPARQESGEFRRSASCLRWCRQAVEHFLRKLRR